MLKLEKWKVGDWVEGREWIGPIVEIRRDDDSANTMVTFECGDTGVRSEAPRHTLRMWKPRDWMVLHLGCDGDYRPACLNLDKRHGWDFETGLFQFPTSSVAGITISHAIQCVRPALLKEVFRQFSRILQVRGVVRITDDETMNPSSSRFEKRAPGTLWDVGLDNTMALLREAGLNAYKCHADETYFDTDILKISHRKDKDFPYYCEGVKIQ